MKTAFIYTEEFERFIYSATHPLKPIRYKLTHALAQDYGLFRMPETALVHPLPCSVEDLATVHSVEYIEAVEHAAVHLPEWELMYYGLATPDNPIFPEVYEWSMLAVGASLHAAKLVASGEADIAFNIAGGLHHAARNRASGFCYFNDVAVVIQYLINQGYRVAYLDLDAHHGDGVQEIFYRSNRVLTISIHESGQYLFPGTGFEREIGMGQGEGYTVNIPLLPRSDDEVFQRAFHDIVPAMLECFQPDILVTQLGVDTFRSDPLATLNVTTNGFCRVLEEVKRIFPHKWVALGGGGYNVFHVPRAWTLAWALMNDIALPDTLPLPYYQMIQRLHCQNGCCKLRDKPHYVDAGSKRRMMEELDKTLAYIRERQLTRLCASR